MQTVSVPSLVRVKPGALDRIGLYLERAGVSRVAMLNSDGLPESITQRVCGSIQARAIEILGEASVQAASFEQAAERFAALPSGVQAMVGLGGGRALDVAKHVAFLAGLPYYATPSSLSNDGYCSPQASLTVSGKRQSLPSRLPVGVVIDTEVCLQAPLPLWWSGVGDLAAKTTAVLDWKLAFAQRGEPVNDLAALLSDATVFQFMARPLRDLEGMRLLGTALLLNGVAMEIAGSSRPASGSEHLISHALDLIATRPRLHGLQVGVAAYVMSQLHGRETERIAQLLDQTGFWQGVQAEPFRLSEWREAVRLAPTLKQDFYTVLSTRDCWPEVEQVLTSDARLEGCITPD